MPPAQLTLDFEPRANWDENDFLEAACNREALSFVRSWPDWPSHAAILFGPPGSGKSHLARIWQARSQARLPDATALQAQANFHSNGFAARPVLIEDADRNATNEHALFHLLNLAKEHDSFVLLTGRAPPGQWSMALPDLRSRIRSFPAFAIGEPDDGLLAAVLVKHFADRQIGVAPDVIPFLLSRMERSMEASQRLAREIDRLALAERRKVTRALAARALKNQQELADANSGSTVAQQS